MNQNLNKFSQICKTINLSLKYKPSKINFYDAIAVLRQKQDQGYYKTTKNLYTKARNKILSKS